MANLQAAVIDRRYRILTSRARSSQSGSTNQPIVDKENSNAPTDRNYASRVVCFCGDRLWSIPGHAKPAHGSLEGFGNRGWKRVSDHQSSTRSIHLHGTTLQFRENQRHQAAAKLSLER